MTASKFLLVNCLASFLLHNEFNCVEALNITRSVSDSFENPDCDSNSCPRICGRYNAECTDNFECKRCHCKKDNSLTFIGDSTSYGGKCYTNDKIVKDSGIVCDTLFKVLLCSISLCCLCIPGVFQSSLPI